VDSVDCSVMITLAEYVLCLQFEKNVVNNFSLEQGSWKADICQSNPEFPNLKGKWTHELESSWPWVPLSHYFFFNWLSALCSRGAYVTVVETAILILFSEKIILFWLQFLFLAPEYCYVSQWRLLFLVYVGSLDGGKWQNSTNCSSKIEKSTLEFHRPRCRWESVIMYLQTDICVRM